ncbi:SAM-dependent methyltransferase [Paucibacter sp. B2R-40]|uniref:class I SAM-dependent methyltransferase n=1 Tax=Paucibacter sp. B2R-40 TaxID=2893554 RepID=UPI0021E45622|nr:SAM-dependent methyltransferase [Paucibacter sp. B2R-40]MCV2357074.1 SAM-dependent methyltransferase [Paucibacter sp. B2R-40]
MTVSKSDSLLDQKIRQAINEAGGWLGFDQFMALALYAPGLGYYSNQRRKFGLMPSAKEGGSDFVTAPEMSPLFGRALAAQVGQALAATATDEVWEFGAGTGALAAQVLQALDEQGQQISSYNIVDLSGSLRQRQAERLSAWSGKVRWLDQLPEAFEGVVLGNEVLDAMPVQLLAFDGRAWAERGVVVDEQTGALAFADRPGAALPPVADVLHFAPGTVTEIHAQAEAFVRTLAASLRRGAVFLIDYGFPEAEYYHPQRSGGTLMCHHEHRADADPLVLLGQKDITAHVNFSGIALAGQDAGLTVLGYTNQAHFLFNCGLAALLETASLAERVMAHKLIAEHEMGELFKVIGFATGDGFDAMGFSAGDRSHSL